MQLSVAIQHFLDHLAVEKQRSPRTITAYTHYLTRFGTWLKRDRDLESLTLDDIRRYRRHLSDLTDEQGEPLSGKTQTYHAVALRSLLRYARKQGVACLAPDQIELPKSPPSQVQFLESEELERLLNAPDTSTMTGLRDRAIMELFFSTGLRVSELAGLTRRDLNTITGELRVLGKGRKERLVLISPRAAGWYETYAAARADSKPAAFVGYRGKGAGISPSAIVQAAATPLTARSIERIIVQRTMEAGIVKHATPHTLRHSFATDLLRGGADIRSLQTLLGHASLTTTQVYTHITDAKLKEVHEKAHGKALDTPAELPKP
jgi:site-specific recombinase XerD